MELQSCKTIDSYQAWILATLSLYRWCADWAKAGECQKNPAWMLKGCPVACGECENKCTDHNTNCKKWADRGECRKNAPYMDIYCAKVSVLISSYLCHFIQFETIN